MFRLSMFRARLDLHLRHPMVIYVTHALMLSYGYLCYLCLSL